MGSERHYPEEAPVHRVTVDSFWIDETPVTNADFRRFVEAAGHVTFAEIAPRRPLHRARAAHRGYLQVPARPHLHGPRRERTAGEGAKVMLVDAEPDEPAKEQVVVDLLHQLPLDVREHGIVFA